MSNDNAFRELEAMIDAAHELELLPQEVAKEAAPSIRQALEATILAGTAPDGTPWQPTQKGERPLKNAYKALDVRVSGTAVIAEVTGIEAMHHLGLARGHVQRRLIPRAGEMPRGVVNAVKVAVERVKARVLGKGR